MDRDENCDQQTIREPISLIRASSFIRHSSFGFRHSNHAH